MSKPTEVKLSWNPDKLNWDVVVGIDINDYPNGFDISIDFIEKSAYTELKKENLKLKKELKKRKIYQKSLDIYQQK